VDRTKKPDTVKMGSERSFGFVFAAFFLIVGLWPLLNDASVRSWALGIGGAFFVVALIYPAILKPLNTAWFRFGLWLARFTTPIVMVLVFTIAVVPTGLTMRLFGKDPMRRKLDNATDTYWIEREEQPGSMKEQY
jgi:hypothetical protein